MTDHPADLLHYPDAELAFGLIAPLGVDISRFRTRFADELRAFGYRSEIIRLSDLLRRVQPAGDGWRLVNEPEHERISSYMTAGNRFREESHRNDALALMAVGEIASKRSASEPIVKKTAWILDSLKHPEEVLTLRQIYDVGFFGIGLYAPESERLRHLIEVRGVPKERAEDLLRRDEEEPVSHGQQARDAFQLSDVFVQVDRSEQMNGAISRFLDLVFGDPHQTPCLDEHAMFLAYAASARSGAVGRQVGAVIVTQGEILAVGANDTPSAGGGQYWPGPDDKRDAAQGHDSNETERDEIVRDIATTIVRSGLLTADRLPAVEEAIRKSRLGDITEYGRDVHAEMEALLACTRTGRSVRGGTLYTTTFPCHNCAKHLVGAGITRIVFVEPYPKSKAVRLHADSLTLEKAEAPPKVLLEPFVGIGPRRYLDLFSLRLGAGSPLKRKSGNLVANWRRDDAAPRVQMRPVAYIEKERRVQAALEEFLLRNDPDHGGLG